MLDRSQVTGLLLCGGASRRMGQDKALLQVSTSVNGQTDGDLLERSARLLEGRCDRVLLATGETPRYTERGYGIVLDRAPGLGPLAGLEAGLRAATTPWVLVLPCDLPQLEPAALDGLLEAAGEHPEADVIHWAGADRVQPLCCLVRSACEGAAMSALDQGRRRVVAFWEEPIEGRRARVHGLVPSELVLTSLWNVNTAEEWSAVRSGTR